MFVGIMGNHGRCCVSDIHVVRRKNSLRMAKTVKRIAVKNGLREPDEKPHSLVRSMANVAQRRGKLVKQPCEVCQTKKNVEKHHPDYRYPFLVSWLCRKHHNELHASLKGARNA